MAPRTLHKLTAAKVKAIKTPGLHEDGGGLRLVVSDAGSKRWVMRISVSCKRHQLGLGSYPTVTLERAREKAADIRRKASDGRDVFEGRNQAALTFIEAFERFFA